MTSDLFAPEDDGSVGAYFEARQARQRAILAKGEAETALREANDIETAATFRLLGLVPGQAATINHQGVSHTGTLHWVRVRYAKVDGQMRATVYGAVGTNSRKTYDGLLVLPFGLSEGIKDRMRTNLDTVCAWLGRDS